MSKTKPLKVVALALKTDLPALKKFFADKFNGRGMEFLGQSCDIQNFTWDDHQEFLYRCQNAQVVILNRWVRTHNLCKSEHLMAQIARQVMEQNSGVKIYAIKASSNGLPAPLLKVPGIRKLKKPRGTTTISLQ